MRISDWSSDVCSSDLPAGPQYASHQTRYSGISVPGSDRPVAILPDRGAEALVQQCFAARRHRTPSDRADNAVRIIPEWVQVEFGRASCRVLVCLYVLFFFVSVFFKKQYLFLIF